MTLLAVAGTGFENIQVVIAFPTAPLAAVGMKLIDRDPARSARTATRAAWAIQMAAGTPETVCQCRRIQMVQLWCSRIDDHVLCHPVGVVATFVRQGLKQSDAIGAHDSSLPASVVLPNQNMRDICTTMYTRATASAASSSVRT